MSTSDLTALAVAWGSIGAFFGYGVAKARRSKREPVGRLDPQARPGALAEEVFGVSFAEHTNQAMALITEPPQSVAPVIPLQRGIHRGGRR